MLLMLLIVRGVILKSQFPLLPSAVGASSRGADARSLSFLGCCALLSLLMITSYFGACYGAHTLTSFYAVLVTFKHTLATRKEGSEKKIVGENLHLRR
jgi:hypothetical protein